VIGICASVEQARWTYWDEQAAVLSMAYVRQVQRAGAAAVLLPPDPEPAELLRVLDGVLLTGGADIGDAPERDAFELELAARALEHDVPVLGVCRGMQVMNVARGGTLISHLPEDVGHTDHRRSLGSFDNADHDVRLAESSLAARAAGETVHATKSHHHQGVDRIGEGLVESGWSVLDDLVEAIEVPGRTYALGVQWHPEVDPRSGIVRSLVAAAGVPASS